MRAVHAASRGTYGAGRVHAELRLGHGIIVGHNAVEMLMRHAGIKGLPTLRMPNTSSVPVTAHQSSHTGRSSTSMTLAASVGASATIRWIVGSSALRTSITSRSWKNGIGRPDGWPVQHATGGQVIQRVPEGSVASIRVIIAKSGCSATTSAHSSARIGGCALLPLHDVPRVRKRWSHSSASGSRSQWETRSPSHSYTSPSSPSTHASSRVAQSVIRRTNSDPGFLVSSWPRRSHSPPSLSEAAQFHKR
ncbi:transposase [Actinoplanes sp. CA-252034]|uniref:transposase n=1 Tax=Actinoplanes sp. CA-252034 TaxID=3239906 RepID=UPI003D99447A